MREILFKAKSVYDGEWVEGYYIRDQYHIGGKDIIFYRKDSDRFTVYTNIIDIETLCQFTGLCDKNGNKIWENDILMCHGNPKDLAKVLFGEFGVRNIETGSIVDKVVGWHYEVVSTDAISRCEPFCWPMPLTEYYIDRCEMEVVGNIFDNPELLQEESNE